MRRALVVGIDVYEHMQALASSVSDARAISGLLAFHEDGAPNFHVDLLTSADQEDVNRGTLRRHCRALFDDFDGDALFYFSGHGMPAEVGGYLLTADGYEDEPGLPMSELVVMANASKARTVLIVLDCCHAGMAGNAPGKPLGHFDMGAPLREGVTILSAAKPDGVAVEIGKHGAFTGLLIGALRGGAADLRGHVSAASIYAYVDAALGAVRSRPMYKSHTSSFEPIRRCAAQVSDAALRELRSFFPNVVDEYQLDPSYERSDLSAVPAHVVIFDKFKRYQVAGLLCCPDEEHLFFVAARSKSVRLTELGRSYCRLVLDSLI